jgi:hypothetical protein
MEAQKLMTMLEEVAIVKKIVTGEMTVSLVIKDGKIQSIANLEEIIESANMKSSSASW